MASNDRYQSKEDKAHDKKMKKLKKDLVFFKVTLPENRERKNKEQDEKAEKWKKDIWMDVLAMK